MGQMLKNFPHRSLWVVGLATAALTAVIDSRRGLDAQLSDITSYIFAVSGTFVALVLPAAELAGNLIARRLEYWAAELSKAGGDIREQKNTAGEAVSYFDEMRNQAIPAWRGSLYVFCAFLASSVALLLPHKFQTCGYVIPSGALLVGVSLAFLLVGSFQFFPFAFYVYRLDLLQNTYSMFKGIADMPLPAGEAGTVHPSPGSSGGGPTGSGSAGAGDGAAGGGGVPGGGASGGGTAVEPAAGGTDESNTGGGGGA